MNTAPNGVQAGRSDHRLTRTTQKLFWEAADQDSIDVLKTGGAIGIFSLLAYLIVQGHFHGGRGPGRMAAWYLLGATCLFFGVAWTRIFRRFWKGWSLMFALTVVAMFGVI